MSSQTVLQGGRGEACSMVGLASFEFMMMGRLFPQKNEDDGGVGIDETKFFQQEDSFDFAGGMVGGDRNISSSGKNRHMARQLRAFISK